MFLGDALDDAERGPRVEIDSVDQMPAEVRRLKRNIRWEVEELTRLSHVGEYARLAAINERCVGQDSDMDAVVEAVAERSVLA